MRKFSVFLAIFALLLAVGVSGNADSYSPKDTPAPERIHVPPAATPEPPPLLNVTKDTSPLEDLRFKLDAKMLHIWFPIIANADEAVITYDDEVWLIDCGDKGMGQRGVRMLQDLGIKKIDKLFNSHPHHDHIGGLQVTHEAAPVSELYMCFPEDAGENSAAAYEYCRSENIPIITFNNGQTFTMGDGKVSLKFFYADDENLDVNNRSAMTMLEYGSRRMLFTADVERPGQTAVLEQVGADNLRADILKYPHHGKSGLLDEFYEAVSPSYVIFTNVYVDWGGVQYIQWKRVPYIFTCTDDFYLHLYSDGSSWIVERVPIGRQ